MLKSCTRQVYNPIFGSRTQPAMTDPKMFSRIMDSVVFQQEVIRKLQEQGPDYKDYFKKKYPGKRLGLGFSSVSGDYSMYGNQFHVFTKTITQTELNLYLY